CSNTPYIPTKEIDKLEKELFFEPRAALDGGADGLDFYRDIIAEARAHLNPGGALVFEIGFDQGDALRALLARAGFLHIRIRRDYANLDRIVTAVNEEEV
ncbi:MAG: peptide chain release factor N(5)-glutamine methyltransferase, partial [Clostridia bacterium]|nr:peptide chain release factor N(5)-glutamine methyltransferase [Clostridia bacterium]